MSDRGHHLHRAHRRREVPAGLLLASERHAVDTAPSGEEHLAKQERLELATQVLDTLDPERRVLLVMYEVYEVPLVDIARALGLKYNTASNRLRLAREDYRAAVKRLRPEQRQAPAARRARGAVPARPADVRTGAAPRARPDTSRRPTGAGRARKGVVAMSRPRARQELDRPPLRCAAGALRGARRAARAVVAAFMGLLCAAEARAAPEPPAVRIEVQRGPGAEGCPDETFLGSEVARRLGADPFEDDAPRALTIHIAREGPELTASLALRDSEGKTQWADGFRTRSGCEELLSGVALAIVAQLLGAPEQADSPPEPSPPSGSAPRSEPSAPPPQARRAAPDPRRPTGPAGAPPRPEPPPAGPERLHLEAGLGASLGLGITPGVATGMTLSFGVRRSDWSIAVEGRGLVSLTQEVAGILMGTTGFTAATLACYRGGPLFGCGLATLGAVRFSARDPWTMTARSDSVFGLGARLGTEWALSRRWSVKGYAEATWMVNEAAFTRVTHDSATPAPLRWTSSPLGAAFGLGVTTNY